MNKKKKNVPKWINDRYLNLWINFKSNEFKTEDAIELFKNNEKTTTDEVPLVLSELTKAQWANVNFDPEDRRRRIYSLKSKDEIFQDELSKVDKEDIATILWSAADLTRGKPAYKIIPILLFLKKLSDGGELWISLKNDLESLPGYFTSAFTDFANKNGLLIDDINVSGFAEFEKTKDNIETVQKWIEILDSINIREIGPNVFEYFLGKYTLQKGQKSPDFYTPRQIINLLVSILDIKPGKIYDPASGSNGMLVTSYRHINDIYDNKNDELFLFGQEYDEEAFILGVMNLYFNGIQNAKIAFGNTLLNPKFKSNDGIKQFDYVMANPPWNQFGYSENNLKQTDFWEQRFKYGFVSKQSADWLWIQHMIASANENGRIGIIIDNGCLVRSGKEKKIRTAISKDDLIESIILLPEKLLHNTSMSCSIIVFNKNKSKDRKNKTLFINASSEYKAKDRGLNVLTNNNIERITDSFNKFQDIEGFCRIVSLEEIKDNDFNLHVPLYFLKTEDAEASDIDLESEFNGLEELEDEFKVIYDDLKDLLREVK